MDQLIHRLLESDEPSIQYKVRAGAIAEDTGSPSRYDILFAMKVMAEAGFIGDARCADALDLLESKALLDGGWAAEERFYKTSANPTTGCDLVGWGQVNRKRMNEWVTYVPIFAENDEGDGIGLVFQNPLLDNPTELKRFSERLLGRLGITPVDIGFDFGTAGLAVNEDIVLLSSSWFQGEDGAHKYDYFVSHFPHHTFFIVPPLAGDVTNDLDMYLWPIAPQAWIASEYPQHTPQADSIAPALRILTESGHTIHRVTGLAPIIYDDVNTMPNYPPLWKLLHVQTPSCLSWGDSSLS